MINIRGGKFDEQPHLYYNDKGVNIPSTTQVFSLLGLVDYEFVKQEVLEYKSEIGTAVHSCIQFWCEERLDWDEVDEQAMPYVVCFEEWAKLVEFQSESQEEIGINTVSGMSYGWRYDHRGTLMFKGKRRKCILDLKTCVKESETWKWQTAAYEMASPALTNGDRYVNVALKLRPAQPAQPFYYDSPQYKQEFTILLAAAILKLNNGWKIKPNEEEVNGESRGTIRGSGESNRLSADSSEGSAGS